ncbi:peptidase S8/S53 domain-containing protein [Mycena latifolia]|nr:peptidase S8/S53 domain-containing protein [Mycena latifolia]
MHFISLFPIALAYVAHLAVKAIPTPESAVPSVPTSPFYIAAQYCADSAVAAVFAITSALHVVPNAGASADCIPVKSSSAAESAIDPDAIPNGFFVKLKDKMQKAAHLDAVNQFIANNAHCSDIKSKVTSTNGRSSIYAGIFAPDVVAFIEQQPLVAGVFPNQRVKVPTEHNLTEPAFLNKNAPWNLARLAQKDVLHPGSLGMGSSDTSQDWTYPLVDLTSQAAKNPVFIYVIDLGVRATHHEFGGRVAPGIDWNGGEATDDVDGHGTAVAGSAAGTTLGSAPLAKIVPVKITSNRQFITTGVITAGVSKALDNWWDFKRPTGAAGIIQLSVETTKSVELEAELAEAIKRGMHVVTAAGNQDKDQCAEWANNVGQINVGAIDIADRRAKFPSQAEPGSNFGPCVEIYAGGRSVRTAGYNSDTEVDTRHGTSFAAPQVAGIIANKIFYGGNKTPAAMKAEILAEAVQGKIVGLEKGSINKIAQLPAPLIQA